MKAATTRASKTPLAQSRPASAWWRPGRRATAFSCAGLPPLGVRVRLRQHGPIVIEGLDMLTIPLEVEDRSRFLILQRHGAYLGGRRAGRVEGGRVAPCLTMSGLNWLAPASIIDLLGR